MAWATPPFMGVSCSPAPQDTLRPQTRSPSDDTWYLISVAWLNLEGPHLLPQLTHPQLCWHGCYNAVRAGSLTAHFTIHCG